MALSYIQMLKQLYHLKDTFWLPEEYIGAKKGSGIPYPVRELDTIITIIYIQNIQFVFGLWTIPNFLLGCMWDLSLSRLLNLSPDSELSTVLTLGELSKESAEAPFMLGIACRKGIVVKWSVPHEITQPFQGRNCCLQIWDRSHGSENIIDSEDLSTTSQLWTGP